MKLERLYKTSSKGATQVIDMEIIGDTYTRTWGQLAGKMQTKATTASPKNVGRSNETTAEEQAILEAKAVWTKKQKANYSTSPEAPVTVKLPMKVNEYYKHKSKVVFPCLTSVKLNGVNVEYRLVDGELKLLSRGGEEYPIPPHQKEEALSVLKHLGTSSINGEMYIHGEHLQDLMAATKKPNDLSPRLVFWIFDFPEVEGDYSTRCSNNYAKLAELKLDAIAAINVGVATSHEDLEEQHTIATDVGYEGIIVRNPKGLYKYNTRSLDVFKLKKALDGEFLVTGFNLDKNGHCVFVASCGDSKEFKVKLKGSNEERLEMASNAESYIGQRLKVEYETVSKSDIPLKPVGIHFRKVGEDGEAFE